MPLQRFIFNLIKGVFRRILYFLSLCKQMNIYIIYKGRAYT